MPTIRNFVAIDVKGVTVLIDEEDAARVALHKWNIFDNKRGHRYAQTTMRIDGVQHRVRMHRFLMNATEGVVDHINGDTTDNRKENLRVADFTVNAVNKRRVNGGPFKARDKWVVRLMTAGVSTYYGCFKTFEEAKAKFDQVIGGSYAR